MPEKKINEFFVNPESNLPKNHKIPELNQKTVIKFILLIFFFN